MKLWQWYILCSADCLSLYKDSVHVTLGWLDSRVVSVLDSGAERHGFQSLLGNSLRQTVYTHRVSVRQAKLVAALLRVAGVTAGLTESNGSLYRRVYDSRPPGWLPRTGISSGTLRSVVDYGIPLPLPLTCNFNLIAKYNVKLYIFGERKTETGNGNKTGAV